MILTCNCYMSIWFSFIYSIHNFLWTTYKTLCATLWRKKRRLWKITPHQQGRSKWCTLEKCKMKIHQADAHLYIGNSVFVLMNRKIGLWNWKRKHSKAKAKLNENTVYNACPSHKCYLSATLYKNLTYKKPPPLQLQ